MPAGTNSPRVVRSNGRLRPGSRDRHIPPMRGTTARSPIAPATFSSHARARQGDKPFAAVVGFLRPPRLTLRPRTCLRITWPDCRRRSRPGAVPEPVRRHRQAHQFENNISELQACHARAAYYAMCEQLDRLCGRILDELERSGLADNTLVVYCSDHGDMLGAHGCWFKSIYYEGSAGVAVDCPVAGQGSCPALRPHPGDFDGHRTNFAMQPARAPCATLTGDRSSN